MYPQSTSPHPPSTIGAPISTLIQLNEGLQASINRIQKLEHCVEVFANGFVGQPPKEVAPSTPSPEGRPTTELMDALARAISNLESQINRYGGLL